MGGGVAQARCQYMSVDKRWQHRLSKKPMANSDTPPKQFDIVVIPFPYPDQRAEKRRPALVVSTNAFNRKHGLLRLAGRIDNNAVKLVRNSHKPNLDFRSFFAII